VAGLWYVIKNGTVRGPFPTGALVQERLLGRLTDSDLIGHDRQEWKPLTSWPELSSAMEAAGPQHKSLEAAAWAGERAKARARWADERGGEDRRAEAPGPPGGDPGRAGADRRSGAEEGLPMRSPRQSDITALFGADVPFWVLIGCVAGLVVLLGLLAYLFGPANPVPVNIR